MAIANPWRNFANRSLFFHAWHARIGGGPAWCGLNRERDQEGAGTRRYPRSWNIGWIPDAAGASCRGQL